MTGHWPWNSISANEGQCWMRPAQRRESGKWQAWRLEGPPPLLQLHAQLDLTSPGPSASAKALSCRPSRQPPPGCGSSWTFLPEERRKVLLEWVYCLLYLLLLSQSPGIQMQICSWHPKIFHLKETKITVVNVLLLVGLLLLFCQSILK